MATRGVSGSIIYGMSTVQMVDGGLLPPTDKAKISTDKHAPNLKGYELITNDAAVNKGIGFSLRERQLLGIHGLLPARTASQDEQVEITMARVRDCECNIDKFVFMMGVQDRNEKLFYKTVTENIEELLPILSHPTVGLACKQFGLVYTKPRGLYITPHDLGHVFEILSNWPKRDIKVVVITDGEKVRGMGDLGVFGIAVPISKCAMYASLGGVPPAQTLPIMLDMGTDNQSLLECKHYVGLKCKRIRDDRYDRLVQEIFDSVVTRFGWSTMIQFEDIESGNAFRFLDQYRAKYASFNDNIQGTAAVVVGAILAAMSNTGLSLKDQRFLFFGSGEGALGIANLLTIALMDLNTGMDEETAKKQIWLMDSKGLIVRNRPSGGLSVNKVRWAHHGKPVNDLLTAVTELQPTCLIGVAGQRGAFTEEIIKLMSKHTDNPIIFSLSNPSTKAECTAEAVHNVSKGRTIYVGGCYYEPSDLTHRMIFTSQVNSLYVSPGLTMAVVACQIRIITEGLFLQAAQILSSLVTPTMYEQGRVLPPINTIHEINVKIAVQLAEYAYKNKLANYFPEPRDKNYFIRSQQYSPRYSPILPSEYDWQLNM